MIVTEIDNTGYTVLTPACMRCDKTSKVKLTAVEFNALNGGGYIQDALAERSTDFRELLISGTHAECWTAMFGDDEDED